SCPTPPPFPARRSSDLVAHQEFKQSEFLWAEFDVVNSTPHRVADAVDLQVFNPQNRARGPVPSAQNSANARGKFDKGKRLGDIVVRTGIEPTDAFLNYARVRHHDHRQIRPFGANPAKDIQPAGSWQIEIQDHEII